METNYRELLAHGAPMASARTVRRECYAWPGGYPMALVVDDGALLCPKCTAENFHEISFSHRHNIDNGWRPVGLAVMDDPDTTDTCAHCGNAID